MRTVTPVFGGRHRPPQRNRRFALSRASLAGVTFVVVGLSAFGIAVTSALAQVEAKRVSVQPAYLLVVPGEVTVPVEAIGGVRERRSEATARKEASARETARQLAARQLAARQLAARQLAARQLAARQLAARQAAARQAVVARYVVGMRASRERAREVRVYRGDVRAIAQGMLAGYGWESSEFGCLDSLWTRESGWRVSAENRSSGAYGIPQALPGSKMASAGADWRTNPRTQITWGLRYIKARYDSPCGAWGHSESHGWY